MTVKPTDFRIDVAKTLGLIRIIALDANGKESAVLEMPMDKARNLIMHILTAVAINYADEPAPPEDMPRIAPAGLPWVPPLRFSYTRGRDANNPPGLILDFGGMTLYFSIDPLSVADVLGRFAESRPKGS